MMVELAPAKSARLKRFYHAVEITEEGGRFPVLLDGRPAKAPGGRMLAPPARPVAEAVAAEWRAQGEAVDLASMPLTRLAIAALDLEAGDGAPWRAAIVDYARTDLLCYRAGEPAALVERQARVWTPYLDWAREALGARFAVTEGVVAVAQSAETLAAVERAVARLDPWRLAAARPATEIAGSAVLGLALAHRAFPAADIFVAARLDERFQAERWGADAEAAAREARLEADFMALARWFELSA
ncbi:ATP12 family chaperone protein [Amphiplicatus metriothermophilus]|uniref:Chaperone required for the assembly of the F1-ATPase n=1 Tax=Amphiplicatus metriothermophilus TaxID=1519374 RepID=A0A239PQM6_9PROT|nr:ATP12 family protein [Amphiplicatus metriothermophilus]MBB5518496.1 chaperone required for assembly of F1-ATPase [Amphiplicatus metriothermophilus]SNT72343.1 Chaperone required for the assembly of the F1-ATPase [Amphiplicatus metriothermophilus]